MGVPKRSTHFYNTYNFTSVSSAPGGEKDNSKIPAAMPPSRNPI
ncbi:MAG: hypothetical protein ACP5OC_08045 [Thermoplasmata archaeon]